MFANIDMKSFNFASVFANTGMFFRRHRIPVIGRHAAGYAIACLRL
ncbi:MAG: hypothetical protein LBS80_03760 [Tannerella sp.]|nr:hypothetical protein [Tannerella sp.]